MKGLLALLRTSGGQAVASSGAVLLLTILTGILTARLLKVEDRGITAAILALTAALAQVSSSGPAETQILAPKRGYAPGVTVRTAWLLGSGVAVAFAVPMLIYLHTLTKPSSWLTFFVVTIPLLGCIGPLCNFLLLGDQRFTASTMLRMSPVIVQAIALIIIWQTGSAGVLTVISGSWIAGMIAGLIGLMLAKPWTRTGGTFKEDGRSLLKLMFTLGGSHAIRIIGYRLDLILLGVIAGGFQAGIYSVAISLSSAGSSLTANLTPLVMTRNAGENSARFTQVSSLVAAIIALGIAVTGPFLIPLVYGGNYRPGWLLIGILAMSMYGSFLLDAGGRIFQRAGYEHVSLRVSLTVLFIQIIAISAGAACFGGIGAAAGNLIAYLSGLGMLLIMTRRLPGTEHESLLRQLSPAMGLRVFTERLNQK
ncbi:oligosaccharide flippase family protein [Pseudomonas sp. Hp2]|uniref:oligosaccharide flippase family protein n=1 Tax=Pseudomonas sp. Hp2 TaxID=701189 RepID=UPI0011266319|nr:oligosaccharide flippase family protein [Pseudomonas sp. Hp2]